MKLKNKILKLINKKGASCKKCIYFVITPERDRIVGFCRRLHNVDLYSYGSCSEFKKKENIIELINR